jgi:hypothetical protein
MRNKLLLIEILVLIVFISGCVQQSPKTIQESNVCGNNICGATEDCNTCIEDCACKPNEQCDNIGICRTDVCGDEICSIEESETQACCEDCRCQSGEICNKVTQSCQETSIISEDDIRKIANDYMNENTIDGTVINIIDAYYKQETLKQANIDCTTEELPYPCQIILYINNEGNIIEEIRTS